ncbi:MAG: hypothetical protein KBB37_03065 [Bacteroidia bacterium]|jgi:hypothetical protein|nr:hypothetical protein [Bacteroidia bacterium]MBP7260244.1 hypothetical protein [Bacteroidia bacterium]MBP9180528.1 hypothetical protein [Bacteroidia bacterium]MBP9724490.1 hypothetical protein [Bacteroidia bacterium]
MYQKRQLRYNSSTGFGFAPSRQYGRNIFNIKTFVIYVAMFLLSLLYIGLMA